MWDVCCHRSFSPLCSCAKSSVCHLKRDPFYLWSFKKTDFKRGNGGVGNSRDHPSTEATMKLGTDPSQNQLPGDTRTDETLTATRGECPIFGETAAGESHLPLFPRVASCSHGGQEAPAPQISGPVQMLACVLLPHSPLCWLSPECLL